MRRATRFDDGNVPWQPDFMNIPDVSARSNSGMVTSPHLLASEAGLKVLAGGGNAMEAAIAMTFCLGVTDPHFCGLGGDVCGGSPFSRNLSPHWQKMEHGTSTKASCPPRLPRD
jgi:gamma-glutamyltranspeptidase/glutathione hydrolase